MTSASDRIVKLDAPVVDPGCCGICGVSNHARGFISMDLHFEFYGSLIFCYDCALSMSAAVGGITPDVAHDMQINAKLATDNILRLTSELEDARLAVLSLTRMHNSNPADFVSLDSVLADVEVDAEPKREESERADSELKAEREGESDPFESFNLEGPLHVSNDGSDDFLNSLDL